MRQEPKPSYLLVIGSFLLILGVSYIGINFYFDNKLSNVISEYSERAALAELPPLPIQEEKPQVITVGKGSVVSLASQDLAQKVVYGSVVSSKQITLGGSVSYETEIEVSKSPYEVWTRYTEYIFSQDYQNITSRQNDDAYVVGAEKDNATFDISIVKLSDNKSKITILQK